MTETYAVDSGDKLTQASVSGVATKTFGYDGAGRTTSIQTSSGTTSFTYDFESRVTGITYPNASTNSFTYNGLDTRVGKTDSAGTATFRRMGAGVTAPVLGDGSASFTPGISERRGSTSSFYGADYLGTNSALYSSGETVSATRQYDAFGNLTSSSGSSANPFGFAGNWGYQNDSDSGLMLLGHRYYDASTGRFLTRDPIQDGRNWYAYCGNNPIGAVDPTGLAFWDDPENPAYSLIVGIGDGASFGITKIFRARMGLSDYVDEGNGWHTGGQIAGNVVGVYLAGVAAGSAWAATVGGPIRLGGAGTWSSHLVRIENAWVHFVPGVSTSSVRALHVHLMFAGLDKLHLPYQLWPVLVALIATGMVLSDLSSSTGGGSHAPPPGPYYVNPSWTKFYD